MKKIEIYVKNYCTFCIKVKSLLNKKNFKIIYKRVFMNLIKPHKILPKILKKINFYNESDEYFKTTNYIALNKNL